MAESRAVSWNDDQVRSLIGVWGEIRVQEEQDGAVRNEHIYYVNFFCYHGTEAHPIRYNTNSTRKNEEEVCVIDQSEVKSTEK